MPASYKGEESIEGKTVIVTGANTGIGKETALELAKRGGRIIMGCRNIEKGQEALKQIVEETRSDQVCLKELDLSSFDSIKKFAKEFNESKLAARSLYVICRSSSDSCLSRKLV
ncbi:retinol dehydrogenase 13 [Elysia marginata]|uniref:Retinol dehydrogenase 13 n=1 Tax=Elysia marginata TaxID=1093978 RepID=A0AAV4FKQ9_9GAST|nr:retinol dehydrogenase 13 [Elysia marginata]